MRLLILAMIVAGCEMAHAAGDTSGGKKDAYTFMYENDLFGKPTSDRDYTMGMSLSHVFREQDNDLLWHRATLGLIRTLDPFENDKQQGSDRAWWSFGSVGYTPQDLTNPSPIRNDRPYASLVFLTAGFSSKQDAAGKTEKKLEWYWGLLGTNTGYAVQNTIHGICCRNRMPKGWSHQIGRGGSPTFMLEESWQTPIGAADKNDRRLGFHYSYGYSVGYYTRLMAGVLFQFGATSDDYHAYNTSLPAAFGPFASNESAPGPGSVQPAEKAMRREESLSGFSAWASYDVSYYLYNELLQGARSGSNDVTFNYSQIAHVVHHLSVGVELSFLYQYFDSAKNWRAYYTQQWSSREITAYPDKPHSWGGLYVARMF